MKLHTLFNGENWKTKREQYNAWKKVESNYWYKAYKSLLTETNKLHLLNTSRWDWKTEKKSIKNK